MKKITHQTGFATVEAMAAVFVVLILIGVGASVWSFGMETLRKRAVAQQLSTVAKAAQDYAQMQGLLYTLTPGNAAITIDTATLTTVGLLPPTPAGEKLTNAWQQAYAIYYYLPPSTPPAPATLTVVVLTTGGRAATESEAAAVSMAGGGGGVIIPSTGGGPGEELRGTGGSYTVPLGKAPMQIPSSGVGRVGYYASLDDAAVLSDVLYRVPVPGRAELNQMRVDLDMRDNSMRNVKSVQYNATSIKSTDMNSICGVNPEEQTAAEGKVFFYTAAGTGGTADHALDGLYACRGGVPSLLADAGNASFIRNTQTVSDGTTIDPAPCPPAQTPFISVSPATLPTGMQSGDTVYSSYTGTGPWTVHLTRYDTAGTPQAVDGGRISVIVSCSR